MVGRRVDARLVEADTQRVILVAADVFALMVVQVADVAVCSTVGVSIASTQVLAAAVAADRVGLGAVIVGAAA